MGALGTLDRFESTTTTGRESAPVEHYHKGGTERVHATYKTLSEAEAAVAQDAVRWLARYGEEAVHVEEGYVSLWRRGVRIDFRTAFSCTNPHCAPSQSRTLPLARRAA